MAGRTTAPDADNSSTSTEEATSLAAVLTRHSWLIRCWLTNFATDDLFSCLQPATQSALLSLTDEELQRLATDLPVRPEWPDELREMLDAARRVAPPATATRVDDATNLPDKFFFGGLPRTRNMGPKKRHEVLRLAPLVARVAREVGAHTIVDLGSGLGYLSHVLAFHHGLHVIGLEASASNVAAAHLRAWMVREKLHNPRFRPARGAAGRHDRASASGDGAADTSRCLPRLTCSGWRRSLAAAAAAAAASAEAAAAASSAGADAAARRALTPRLARRRQLLQPCRAAAPDVPPRLARGVTHTGGRSD